MPERGLETSLLAGPAALVAATLAAVTGFGGAAVLLPVPGKRIVDRLPERVFVFLIEATMTAAGLLFLIRGY